MSYNSLLIIGTGRTGSIAAEQATRYVLEEIFLFNRNPEKAKQLCSRINDSRLKVLDDLANAPSDVDLILDFSSAYPREQKAADIREVIEKGLNYELIRQKDLEFNLEAKRNIYKMIKAKGLPADVVIYTNPVDVLVAYVSFLLERRNVYGAGLQLDLARAKQVLNEESGAEDSKLANLRVVGLHNQPIVLARERNLAVDYAVIKQGVQRLLKASKETPEISRQVQISAISNLLEFLLGEESPCGDEKRFHLSLPYHEVVFSNYDIAIGLPVVRNKDGKIEKQLVNLSGEEQRLFAEQVASVRSSLQEIRREELACWSYPKLTGVVEQAAAASFAASYLAACLSPLFAEPSELFLLLQYAGV